MAATCHKQVGTYLAMLVAACVLASAAPAPVQAQDAAPAEQKAGPDGLIGLGLIGAEIGMIVPAAFGVSETWPYLVFPAVGAIGGGIAGVFLLQDGAFLPDAGAGHPEIAVASFAVGLVGLIPSLVVVMSATAYDPEDEDGLARRLPGSDAGSGLVRLGQGGTYVAVPGVAVEQHPADVRRQTESRQEVSVAVLSGNF